MVIKYLFKINYKQSQGLLLKHKKGEWTRLKETKTYINKN